MSSKTWKIATIRSDKRLNWIKKAWDYRVGLDSKFCSTSELHVYLIQIPIVEVLDSDLKDIVA